MSPASYSNSAPSQYGGALSGINQVGEPAVEKRGVFAEIDRLNNSIDRANTAAQALREKLGPTLPQLPKAECRKDMPSPDNYGHSALCCIILELHMRVDGLCGTLNTLLEEVEI